MDSTDNFLRYSCQMQLPGFGEAKQKLLKQSKVLIAGAGGLGCPAAQYLAAAGAGTITIADFDTISTGNLHRQVLYTQSEVGLMKAEVACRKLQEQNPQIQLVPFTGKITSENAMHLISSHDIVIDGTDNFETRYLLNDGCVLAGKPLVHGAIYQYEGQVSVWNVLNDDGTRSPNYRDLFPEVDAAMIPNCAEGGVIPTLAGIIGCMQANEAIKIITQTGETLAGKMLLLDAQTLQSRILNIGRVSKTRVTHLTESSKVALITIDELKSKLDDPDCELIDVRTAEERSTFNIGGKHIPIAVLEKGVQNIDIKKTVIFYCASGTRSAEAVKIFHKYFPGNEAFSLEGGMKAWKEKEAAEIH